LTPEPGFDKAVLWTVPLSDTLTWDNDRNMIKATTSTASFLNGIIYVRTKTMLLAISMHNGVELWNMVLPSYGEKSVQPVIAPVIATRSVNGIQTNFLLVNSVNENDDPTFVEIGTCSGNGYYNSGYPTRNACGCLKNYYGTNCNVFCNVTACESQNQLKGMCGPSGCVCSNNYFGTNCEIYCSPATNCSGQGTCVQPTGSCMCKSLNLTSVDFMVYSGLNCEKSQMNWLLIIAIAAGGLVLILVIAIVVIICTRKSRPNEYDLINSAS